MRVCVEGQVVVLKNKHVHEDLQKSDYHVIKCVASFNHALIFEQEVKVHTDALIGENSGGAPKRGREMP